MSKNGVGMPTPGEWSYRKCPCPNVSVVPKDRGTLYLVQYLDEAEKCRGEIAITQGKQSKANACLMAASKQMLEALYEAEAGLCFAGADRKFRKGQFVPAPTLALKIVRAAIAQATGRKKGAAS
jgi:hypothetical protein